MNDRDKMDEKLVELMLSSTTVQEWNENRETAKEIRDTQWISKNIDSALLIHKSKITKEVVNGESK